MTNQISFDFFDDTPVYSELPDGSWERTYLEDDALTEYLAKAKASLETAPDTVRGLFKKGIEGCDNVTALRDIAEDECVAFAELCTALAKHQGATINAKVSKRKKVTTFALHVPDVGTIELNQWSNGSSWMQYLVGKSPFFLKSYVEERQSQFVPYANWYSAYSADVIAYSGKGIATVKTVDFGGRQYTVTSLQYDRDYVEGQAWSFCRLEDWKGPIYNYASQHVAVDRGRIERGDYRGLVVLVRGEKVVIDGSILFFDDKGGSAQQLDRLRSEENDVQDVLIIDDSEEDIEEDMEELCTA